MAGFPPTSSPPLRSWLLLASLAILAAGIMACGGDNAQSPTPLAVTGTTAESGSVSISVSAVTIRRAAVSPPSRVAYDLSGTVSFRDTGTTGFRVNGLEIDIEDGQGLIDRQTVGLDLVIEPGGTATAPLPGTLVLPAGREPQRLRVRGAGLDRGGQRRMTPAGEAALTVTDGSSSSPAAIGGEVTFVGAGDIADCSTTGAQATARLLDAIPGEVFTLGDNVYPSGDAALFKSCYEPSWGRHKARTRPVIGNHDWGVEYGKPYFDYFGPNAGPRPGGFYSFDLGAWHIIALNSSLGVGPDSAQFAWLRADLAAHPNRCTLAMWHHPRFSSGPNGNTAEMQPAWALLNNAGVDLVLSGHDHYYERFAKQDHEGVPTPRGMRSFVVGTGGTLLASAAVPRPNSEVRGDAWGVLKLTLRAADYSWEFVPVPGARFRDSGADTCR